MGFKNKIKNLYKSSSTIFHILRTDFHTKSKTAVFSTLDNVNHCCAGICYHFQHETITEIKNNSKRKLKILKGKKKPK